jgi:hypothetical protein
LRKAELAEVISRRLGVRKGRLISLVQRLSEAGQLRTNSSRRLDFDLTPIEAARMLIIALVDTGLAAAPETTELYGRLSGRGSNFEEALGHALARPTMIAPTRSGLEIHTDSDSPYVAMTIVTPDGVTTQVYGDMPDAENVDRLVTVSGGALFAIAQEFAGLSQADVDRLLEGGKKPAASAAN